jgi:predicted enzyme related to lactoylglutathione lyase
LALLLSCLLCVPLGAAEVPPLNTPPTSDQFPGKFIWADLFTADQEAAAKFYTALFGWTSAVISRDSDRGVHDYIVLANAGRPVAGIALLRPEKMPGRSHGRWIEYISVADVPQALAAAVAGGGRVVFPAKDLPQRGVQAIITDPEGAFLGLMHSASGDPGEYRPDPGDWTWSQLFSRDPATASRYYQTAFGYEIFPDSRLARPDTFLLGSGTFARASIGPLLSRPNAKPAWLGYVRVPDLKAALARVPGLGGRILIQPRALGTDGQLAVIADSVGAAIGLVEHAEEDQGAAATPPPVP